MEEWLTEQAPGGQKKPKVLGYSHPCKLFFPTPLYKEQGASSPACVSRELVGSFEAALTHALVLLRVAVYVAVCPRSHSPVDIT